MKTGYTVLADSGTNELRQQRAEEDDEERFQADLKKAVRQSLGKIILSFIWNSLCYVIYALIDRLLD